MDSKRTSVSEVMRKNGKAFFWASLFLPRNEAEDVAILYAFCRYIDDLVDIKGESCSAIQADLESQKSSTEPLASLLNMASRRKMSLEPAKILVQTLAKDIRGCRIATWGELLRYCYGVAGTVGLMLCDIFNVQEKRAHPFAIDLGIGMQLTNIARDIYEDAVLDRLYLPQEAFCKRLTTKDIISGDRQEEVLKVREQILTLADLYYKSADQGMHFLPRRVRLAIMLASRLYQAKGQTIRKNSTLYLKKRADVQLGGKALITAKALRAFFLEPVFFESTPTLHNASLHQELHFLYTTNPP